jgi:TPP-dependent pyruvate/acetoin dehydrogenase alpha subunit
MGYADHLTATDLVQMYRMLVLTRAFEDKVTELWTTGVIVEGHHGSRGQEAIAIGACHGLRADDQVMPSLRSRGAFFARGIPARVQMAGMYARATGPAKGKATSHHMADPARGVLLSSGLIGSSLTVATGAALAFRYQHRDAMVVCFFGDGGAQRGDFHESLNFAGVFRLPIVYVLENNGWAEFTPLSKHFAGTDFACRAQGYGFPGVRIDGNDVLAVHEAVQTAAARARAGEGPTLIECVTYRMRGHTESQHPNYLRDPAEVEAWRAKDPLARFRAELERRGVLGEDQRHAIDMEAAAEVEDSVRFAAASPPPSTDELYRDVYVPDDPALVAGRPS